MIQIRRNEYGTPHVRECVVDPGNNVTLLQLSIGFATADRQRRPPTAGATRSEDTRRCVAVISAQFVKPLVKPTKSDVIDDTADRIEIRMRRTSSPPEIVLPLDKLPVILSMRLDSKGPAQYTMRAHTAVILQSAEPMML